MKTQLQALRKRAGYKSARIFAEHIGMNPGTYTAYEQGKRPLTVELAWSLADELGCSLDEIAGREYRPSPEFAALSNQERTVLAAMRTTDARGRNTVEAVARVQENQASV